MPSEANPSVLLRLHCVGAVGYAVMILVAVPKKSCSFRRGRWWLDFSGRLAG